MSRTDANRPTGDRAARQEISGQNVPADNSHEILKTQAAAEYDAADDVTKSFEEAYRAIRERIAAGGPGWVPK